MFDRYLDHHTEDALARFLLQQCQGDELEAVETHIFACEPCVTRLEELELQITATKLALQELESERSAREAAKRQHSWKSWFTVPTLSWATGAACLALALLAVPRFVPANVGLSAYRGLESPTAPEGRPLDLHLNAADLAEGRIDVEVVDSDGSELWKGSANIQHDQAEVVVPRITEPGAHFVRLYAPAQDAGESPLLREFAFRIK